MFNPWQIVSWLGAVAVALLITVLTVRLLINLIKPSKTTSTTILRDRSTR